MGCAKALHWKEVLLQEDHLDKEQRKGSKECYSSIHHCLLVTYIQNSMKEFAISKVVKQFHSTVPISSTKMNHAYFVVFKKRDAAFSMLICTQNPCSLLLN